MPRKQRVYWINAPRDLEKCHSRRCEESAVKDRLCAPHWTTWSMADFQPAQPATYSGRTVPTEQPPLKVELEERKAVVEDAIHEIASMATDDAETPVALEQVIAELEAEKAAVQEQKRESIAPYLTAQARTERWFAPVEKQLDAALELASARLETARSSVRPVAFGTRVPRVNVSARRKQG